MTDRQAAIKVIKQLHRNGFQALLAGGCVRDMLLKRKAKDYDVVTNAIPDEVSVLFKRTIKIGAKFGVVMVLIEDRKIEVATFRSESGYDDGRHPRNISFSDAKADASRRDFTINGMFYDPLKKEIIDYVDGKKDLEKRIIRTIGDPDERFCEDYLRMLRAVRFSAQLDFEIHRKTLTAIRKNANNITDISGERISAELEGIMASSDPAKGISLLTKTGLIKKIFPDMTKQKLDFGIETLSFLTETADYPLSIAALFSACEPVRVANWLKILRLSNNQMKHINYLLKNRMKLLQPDMPLSELRLMLASPYYGDCFDLQQAVQKAGGESDENLKKLKRRIKSLGDIEFRPEPLLNGHELIRLGVVPGPALGKVSREMYIAQLEGQINTKHQAKEWIKNKLTEQKNMD